MQQVEREKFVEQFRARLGPEGLANALAELAKEENQSTMGRAQFNAYLLRNKIMLNKVEFDSVFERWEGAGGTADVLAFLLEVEAVPPGLDPGWYTNVLSLGTNRDHLKLQGVSTVDFNVQNKPYPEHWGKPPNVNFKGHDGVVRDLPGGYGRGNRALYRWVDEHMKHDEETWTNPQNGLGPYPYGNASYGCTPRVGPPRDYSVKHYLPGFGEHFG